MSIDQDYVVNHARREGLAEIAVSNFELLRIASGHPMVVSTMTGERVCLRLAGAGELIQQQAEAARDMPEGIRPPAMSAEQAENLSRPLPS